MNDENFYAWLAGFIDGEGCWKIYNGKPYFELCQKGWNGHRMLTYSRAKRENRGPQATPSQLLPN